MVLRASGVSLVQSKQPLVKQLKFALNFNLLRILCCRLGATFSSAQGFLLYAQGLLLEVLGDQTGPWGIKLGSAVYYLFGLAKSIILPILQLKEQVQCSYLPGGCTFRDESRRSVVCRTGSEEVEFGEQNSHLERVQEAEGGPMTPGTPDPVNSPSLGASCRLCCPFSAELGFPPAPAGQEVPLHLHIGLLAPDPCRKWSRSGQGHWAARSPIKLQSEEGADPITWREHQEPQ